MFAPEPCQVPPRYLLWPEGNVTTEHKTNQQLPWWLNSQNNAPFGHDRGHIFSALRNTVAPPEMRARDYTSSACARAPPSASGLGDSGKKGGVSCAYTSREACARRTDFFREVLQCPDAAHLRVEHAAEIHDKLAIISMQGLSGGGRVDRDHLA